MSYLNQYFTVYNGTTYDINTLFDSSSPGSGDATNVYATNTTTLTPTDLNDIYTTLGTNSNLQWPHPTNIITSVSKDLNETFALNLIDTIKTTPSTYTQYAVSNGTYIRITGGGDIYFNYNLSNISFYMIGGGGGGGAMAASNAGGGGGSGGYLSGTINTTNISSINSSIGGLGTGGHNTGYNGSVGVYNPNAYGYNGGNTVLTFYDTSGNSYNATVYGGGGGGGGKGDGIDGGCGGGSGSYSTKSSSPGSSIAGTYDSGFKITKNGYYYGGQGQDNNGDNGRGGGGGGCGYTGGSGQNGGNGGYGLLYITDSNGNIIAYFSGGGGGGGPSNGDGGSGQNGGGNGGGNGQGGYDASGNPYFGGGGGGASNASSGAGGNGVSGVIILYITNDMITYP